MLLIHIYLNLQRSSSSPSLYKKSNEQAASHSHLRCPSSDLLKQTSPTNGCSSECSCAGAKNPHNSSRKPAHGPQGKNTNGDKCKCPYQNPLCCDSSVVSSSRTSIQNDYGECSSVYSNGSCDINKPVSSSLSSLSSSGPGMYDRMNGEAQYQNGSVESLNGESKEELDDITRQIENLTRTVDDLQKSLSSLNSSDIEEEQASELKSKKKRKDGKKSKSRLHSSSNSRKNKSSDMDLSDPMVS